MRIYIVIFLIALQGCRMMHLSGEIDFFDADEAKCQQRLELEYKLPADD